MSSLQAGIKIFALALLIQLISRVVFSQTTKNPNQKFNIEGVYLTYRTAEYIDGKLVGEVKMPTIFGTDTLYSTYTVVKRESLLMKIEMRTYKSSELLMMNSMGLIRFEASDKGYDLYSGMNKYGTLIDDILTIKLSKRDMNTGAITQTVIMESKKEVTRKPDIPPKQR